MRVVTETLPLSLSTILSPSPADSSPSAPLLANSTHSTVAWFPSGRDAIAGALLDAGIEPDEEVIIPGYTCHAVDNSVRAVAKPVHVDVTRTLDLDVSHLRDRLSPETAAVVPTHLYGFTTNVKEVAAVAREHDVTVIEDAAQAFGNVFESSPVGEHADYTALSLRYFKEVTAYRGGLLLGSSLETEPSGTEQGFKRVRLAGVSVADRLLSALPGRVYEPVRTHVLDPRARSASATANPAEPVSPRRWTTDVVASQIGDLEARIEARRRNASIYDETLGGIFESPAVATSSTYFRYPIFVPDGARDRLCRVLRRRGIGVSTMYAYCVGAKADCPTAARLAREMLNLPVHAGLSRDDIRDIAEVVADTWDVFE